MPNNEINIINFDWKNNPLVNWICQDADGEWWGFQDKPVIVDYTWIPSNPGSYWEMIERKEPNSKWKETLTKRP